MPVPTMGKYQGVVFGESGEFHEYYKKIKKTVCGDKLKHLAGLASAEERARYLLTLPDINTISSKAHQPIFSKEKALALKEKGNDFFRQHNYGEAFKHYTQSLQHCQINEAVPEDACNKDYSIILANRSAALDGAGLYEACIRDIDRSIQFGYPKELWYKIYKRKGHAYVKLRQYIKAKEALEIALKFVGRSDIKKEKDRDNYRVRIRKQMSVFNVTKTLYNCDLNERAASCLAGGEETDRGMSNKLKISENLLLAAEDIQPEDNLVSLEPYVAVVNVSGGRAGGKICPHNINKMFNPVPCKFGSEELFGSLEARDEASLGYHSYEWSILANLAEANLLEPARLALRMVTQLEPGLVPQMVELLGSDTSAAEKSLQAAAKTFNLDISMAKDEDRLVAALLGLYLMRNLTSSGYIRSASKDQKSLGEEELKVFKLLERAVLVSIFHVRPIHLFDVPKKKDGYIDTKVARDVCAFGIYPDLPRIEAVAAGPETHVFTWNLDKKLVMTSFRTVEAGQPVYVVERKPSTEVAGGQQATDMITFRCANELCSNYFPLKENTKEKIIACPLEDCGLKTNIWERLKLIQRLKKDFASAKLEFENSEVGVCRDILKGTIEEWDRIIQRPYREVEQLQALYLKCLLCIVADTEREFYEGNQMGMLFNRTKKMDVYPKDEEATGMTTKTFELKPPS